MTVLHLIIIVIVSIAIGCVAARITNLSSNLNFKYDEGSHFVGSIVGFVAFAIMLTLSLNGWQGTIDGLNHLLNSKI